MVKKIIIWALILFMLCAAIAFRDRLPLPVAFKTMGKTISLNLGPSWNGDISTAKQFSLDYARTYDEWGRMWQKVDYNGVIIALPPKQMGIAIYGGDRATNGYTIRINRVTENDYQYTVYYSIDAPASGKGSPYTTSPWLIQLVPYSDKPVMFAEGTGTWYYYLMVVIDSITGTFDKLFNSGLYKK